MREVPKVLTLVLAVTGALAASKPGTIDAATALAHAREVTNIKSEGAPPFHLRASLWIAEAKQDGKEGRYEIWWRAPSSWREEIDYPGRHQIAGQDGERAWILTDAPYQSLRIFDVVNAIDVAASAKLPAGGTIESVKESHRAGTKIRLRQHGRFPWSEIIIDAQIGAPIRHETGPSASAMQRFRTTIEYENYRPWHERSFPALIRRRDASKTVLEIRVMELEDLDSDAARWSRPDGATNRPICTDEELAAELSCDIGPEMPLDTPQFPGTRSSGTASVRAVLARDGRVHDIVVVDSLNFEADGELIRYLESWRCRPLTCGGVPVDAEIFESRPFSYVSASSP
ncbi:MAG TPA: hypothetical protein VFV19_11545 [Candidatus Polarisedimenticolaceae bacterium]|nr:hypothetical protein [Candidatus Polarisedimenticolaceae bacterium]